MHFAAKGGGERGAPRRSHCRRMDAARRPLRPSCHKPGRHRHTTVTGPREDRRRRSGRKRPSCKRRRTRRRAKPRPEQRSKRLESKIAWLVPKLDAERQPEEKLRAGGKYVTTTRRSKDPRICQCGRRIRADDHVFAREVEPRDQAKNELRSRRTTEREAEAHEQPRIDVACCFGERIAALVEGCLQVEGADRSAKSDARGKAYGRTARRDARCRSNESVERAQVEAIDVHREVELAFARFRQEKPSNEARRDDPKVVAQFEHRAPAEGWLLLATVAAV